MTSTATSLVVNPYRISEERWDYLARVSGGPLPDPDVDTFGYSKAGTGVPLFVLFRESGLDQADRLASLAERVFVTIRHEPGVEQLLEDGIGPLLQPERFPGVIHMVWPEGRAAVWARSGTWVLMMLGSAAMNDVDMNGQPLSGGDVRDGRNSVSMIIETVLDKLLPQTCRVGDFDRLVRAYENSPDLLAAFQRNVGWLEFGLVSMPMAGSATRQTWQQLTLQSTAAHSAVVGKTTEGRLSAVRSGWWPFGAATVPPGFALGAGRLLVVCAEDAPAVRLVVESLADGDASLNDVARRLVEQGLPRRRMEWAESRTVDGVTVPVSGEAEFKRASWWLRRFVLALPDLALGKFVTSMQQPRSMDEVYLGFRPVKRDGRWFHQLAWDVPDPFVDGRGELLVPEAVLDRAVRNAVVRRVQLGLVPSLWLHELQERDKVARLLAERSGPRDTLRDQIARWARHDGSMISVLAPGRHPRTDHVKPLILSAAEGAGPRRSSPGQLRNSFLAGLPAWVGRDGNEWWLSADKDTYALCSRERDPALGRRESLLRARNITSYKKDRGPVRASVKKLALHRSVADALVEAIEVGVPHLGSGFDYDRSDAVGFVADHEVTLAGEVSALEERVAQAKATVETLMRGQMLLAGTAPEDAGLTPTVHALKLKVADAHVNEACETLASLEEELAAYRALTETDTAAAPTGEPTLGDMELLLDLLVTLRTERQGSARAVRLCHRLLSSFEAELVDGYVCWEATMCIGLPGGEERIVGPVRGRVIATGRSDVTEIDWDYHHARHLCTQSLDPGPLLEGADMRARKGKKQRSPAQKCLGHAVDYLAKKIGQRAAYVTMTCPSLQVRHLIWNLAHEADPGAQVPVTTPELTPEYMAAMRAVYVGGGGLTARVYHDVGRPRQPILDAVIAAGGQCDVEPLAAAVIRDKRDDSADSRAHGRRAGVETGQRAGTAAKVGRLRSLMYNQKDMNWWPVVDTVKAQDPTSKIVAYRTHTCPHCRDEGVEHPLDLVLWVPEVPTGVMCSRCMRMPITDSPVYPGFYRAISRELGREEQPLRPKGTPSGAHRRRGSDPR